MAELHFEHRPVLLDACIEGLNIKPDGCYLDGTVGGAGHSAAIAARLTTGRLFCIDKDPEAIAAATARLGIFPTVKIMQGDFRDARTQLGLVDGQLDGALLDLGVSSHQLDRAERGFSYHNEGALDMRMSRQGQSAADLINALPWQQLADILRRYGEEPYAGPIARKIEAARATRPITTTLELGEIVASALPPAVRRKEKHPARRTFQALRIAVNDELGALEEGLEEIFKLLAPRGRFCVITFHSLEDRIVKQFFAALQTGCTCPPDFPQCVCGKSARAKAVTRRPITASEEECGANRRARSAKLRIVEKEQT